MWDGTWDTTSDRHILGLKMSNSKMARELSCRFPYRFSFTFTAEVSVLHTRQMAVMGIRLDAIKTDNYEYNGPCTRFMDDYGRYSSVFRAANGRYSPKFRASNGHAHYSTTEANYHGVTILHLLSELEFS